MPRTHLCLRCLFMHIAKVATREHVEDVHRHAVHRLTDFGNNLCWQPCDWLARPLQSIHNFNVLIA